MLNRAMFLILSAIVIISFGPIQHAYAERMSSQKNNNVEQELGIIGYNYTNSDIESYTVNDAGGGHIRRSSFTNGGGGITCCIKTSLVQPPKAVVKVRWQADGCMYVLRNDLTGASQEIRHLFFKEKLVQVEDFSKGNPQYIETHIYKDEKVRIRLTREISLPLLLLNENRPDQSSFPRCKDGKKPK